MIKSLSGKDLEIGKAISEWLSNVGYSKTLENFLIESGISQSDIPKTKTLEKKWTTILTMQKKITDLENRMKTMKEEYEQASVSGLAYSTKNQTSSSMGIPRAPEKHSLTAHRAAISCLTFHPIYNLLVSCSDDASIIVWDCSESEIKQDQFIRAHTNAINGISFDTHGKLLASCSSDLSIKIWKFDNPMKCIKTLSGHEHLVSAVEFSPDNNLLYSCSRDKTIKVWEVSSGSCKITFKGHDEWVRSISLNDKGNTLASCSDDETVIIWSEKGEARNQFSGHNNKIEKVIFVKNEAAKQAIYTGDYGSFGNVQEENVSEQIGLANELNKKLADQSKLAKKIDKDFLFTASRDKTIKLWDIKNASCLYTFEGHDNWVRNIVVHPTGKYLISTGDDRNIRIWDMKSGRSVKKLDKVHDKFIISLAMHANLNLLVSGSNDLSIKFWDCK